MDELSSLGSGISCTATGAKTACSSASSIILSYWTSSSLSSSSDADAGAFYARPGEDPYAADQRRRARERDERSEVIA